MATSLAPHNGAMGGPSHLACRKAAVRPEFSRKLAELGMRHVHAMPEATVNESALGQSWKKTYNAATKKEAEAVMHSSPASGGLLNPGSATRDSEGSPHGQAVHLHFGHRGFHWQERCSHQGC